MNGHCGRGERPGGEQSPREYRVEVEWQHTAAATDSAMEQGLEVGDRVINGTALVATLGAGKEVTRWKREREALRCGW